MKSMINVGSTFRNTWVRDPHGTAVSPGPVLLNPGVLPRAGPAHCPPAAVPEQGISGSSQGISGSSQHARTEGCPLLQTPPGVPSPAAPPEAQRKSRAPIPGSLPGTARAPRQQLMGKFRVGARRGEAHKGPFVPQVSPGSVHGAHGPTTKCSPEI